MNFFAALFEITTIKGSKSLPSCAFTIVPACTGFQDGTSVCIRSNHRAAAEVIDGLRGFGVRRQHHLHKGYVFVEESGDTMGWKRQ